MAGDDNGARLSERDADFEARLQALEETLGLLLQVAQEDTLDPIQLATRASRAIIESRLKRETSRKKE